MDSMSPSRPLKTQPEHHSCRIFKLTVARERHLGVWFLSVEMTTHSDQLYKLPLALEANARTSNTSAFLARSSFQAFFQVPAQSNLARSVSRITR